jgi:hypothetical protein
MYNYIYISLSLSLSLPDMPAGNQEQTMFVLDSLTFRWVLIWFYPSFGELLALRRGKPLFGTLIALLRDGRPILGIIDQSLGG